MKTKQQQLKETLDSYLSSYLSKRWIKMTAVLRGVQSDLRQKGYISKKQFKSIYPLINKEQRFVGMSESELTEFFSPLFVAPPRPSSSTLDQFLL